MPRNPELDLLHEQVQRAFEAKQAKFAELKIAREQTNAAYASLQLVRSEHDSAFAEMKRLRVELDESSRNYDAVWDEYARLKESLSSRIDSLKAEANEEHRMMSECFDQASNEYGYGDRGLASSYSQDGHAHKANRDALNEEVSELCRELKAAREDAQWRAPKTDSSEYRAAKARFDQVKSRLDEARRVFDAVKASRGDPALVSYPGVRQWGPIRHGWIDGCPVTWCEGTGINAGQTLICDGHVDRDEFDKHHDHYGPNVKYKNGGRIEDITDALGRKKYYGGPGKIKPTFKESLQCRRLLFIIWNKENE